MTSTSSVISLLSSNSILSDYSRQSRLTISLDAVSKSVTVLSTAGVLFVPDTPQTRLDLKTVCGDSKHAWTAVGSRSNRILAAGLDTSNMTIEYVLVDA